MSDQQVLSTADVALLAVEPLQGWRKQVLRMLQNLVSGINPPGLYRLVRVLGPHVFIRERYRARFRDRFEFVFQPHTLFTLLTGCGIVHRGLDVLLEIIYKEIADSTIVFFDIGANEGFVSLLATSRGRLVNKEVQAHCFEPSPLALEVLHYNVSLNNLDLFVNPVAVAERSGQQLMQFSRESIDSTLLPAAQPNTVATSQVTLISLDEYCAAGNIKPNIIKIDVEGYEPYVLSGAQETLRVGRPFLLLEINERMLRQGNSSSENLLAQLRDAEYALFYVDNTIADIAKTGVTQQPNWHGLQPVEIGDHFHEMLWDVLAVPQELVADLVHLSHDKISVVGK